MSLTYQFFVGFLLGACVNALLVIVFTKLQDWKGEP